MNTHITDRTLTGADLAPLAELYAAIIHRDPVRFTTDRSGRDVHEGVLRHLDSQHAADIRDRQVRITMSSPGWAGADLWLKVSDITDKMTVGEFAIDA